MKKVSYSCDCHYTFDIIFVEKGDRILLRDDSGRKHKVIVENPYNYVPVPEACPMCNFCPSDDFIERVLGG